MPDISELIIQVKKTDDAVNQIKRVTNALNQTGKTAQTVGKGLFAAWSFTKVIQGARLLSNAFKDVAVQFNNFSILYGKINHQADEAVKTLTDNFAETERSARKLLNLIGTRTFGFRFDKQTFTRINTEIAKTAEEVGAFMQLDPSEVAADISRAMSGMTRSMQKYGIIVDQNSQSFKDEVKQLQLLRGETEEGAKALAIWNQINSKMGEFKGAFQTQQKSLSFAFENLTNTLKSGAFAKAGEMLSKIFVPILDKVNSILQKPWVTEIAGIVIALGGIVIAIKSITMAMGALKTTLAAIKAAEIASGVASGAAGGILGKLSSWFAGAIGGIMVALKGILLKAVAGIAAFLSGPIGWAVIAALAAASTLLVNKLTTGSWFDYAGTIEAITGWFKRVSDHLVSLFRTGSWETEGEKRSNWYNEVKSTTDAYQKQFKQMNEQFQNFSKSMDLSGLKNVSTKEKEAIQKLKESYDKSYKNLLRSEEALQREKKEFDKLNRLRQLAADRGDVKTLRKIVDKQSLNLQSQATISKNSLRFYQESKDLSEKVKTAYSNLTKIDKENLLKQQQELRELTAQAQSALNLKTVWIDINESIREMGKFSTKDTKLKTLQKKIDEYNEFINGDIDEQARINALNRIAELEKEKAKIELDSLDKEYETIKNTNDMILEFAKEAAQFKARGVSAIQAGTMEDYKFITSSIGKVDMYNSALRNMNNDTIKLDQDRNAILESLSKNLDRIRQKVESESGIKLESVNAFQ